MVRRRRPVDFTEFEEARRWFAGQPREIAVALAVRAALRALPVLCRAKDEPRFLARLLLPSCRAVAIAAAVAEHPAQAAHLRGYATAAADATADAARTAAYTTAARAAAARAHAAAATAAATDAAYPAAYAAAYTTADAAVTAATYTAALRADTVAIEEGQTAAAIAAMPLWADRTHEPEAIAGAWTELQMLLLAAGDDWDVWVRWYQDRLDGRPSLGEAFDLAVATLPDELWRLGPATVNAKIKELVAEHTPVGPIPAQGAGPHFALSPELKIALAPPGEIDAEGNNMARIGNLLPVVRQAAGDLAGHLNPNTQPEISRIVGDYGAAISGEPDGIAWGNVFGLGVRLENAAAASRRDIADRLRDPLEDAPQEALDSLLTLHGPLMLATAEGRELADEADRFRQTREQQAELRRHAQLIAANLRNSPEIIEAPAARLGEEAASAIGEGPHPERGTVFGLATVRNIGTLLVAAGTLGTIHWIASRVAGGGETGVAFGAAAASFAGFKAAEIDRVRNAARVFGSDFAELVRDQADLVQAQTAARLRLLVPFRDFVTTNEEPLRRIAENSTQLRWMLSYIDFITRHNRPP